jgi:hypothetical protein
MSKIQQFLTENNIHFDTDFNSVLSWIEIYKDNRIVLMVDDNIPLKIFKDFIIDAASEDITIEEMDYYPYWFYVYNYMELHLLFMPIIDKFK